VQKIRVIDIAHPVHRDIDSDRHIDVLVMDGFVNRCSSAATSALKRPPRGYTELQAAHISWIFDSMRFTHVTIRNLLTQGPRTPACVDALALTRLQLETLYSVCLICQAPNFADDYVKNFWKDNYVRFLLVREEHKNLPRFDSYINRDGQMVLAQLQQASGVTDEERATVELEELGTSLPSGMKLAKIRRFPQPSGVISGIADPDRKRMLMRLYPEYRRLCAFAHGSPQSTMFKTAFWERSPLQRVIPESSRQNVFEKEVGEPAIFYSSFAVVQSVCELATMYPSDIELKRTVIEAWNLLSDSHLLGRIIWEIRAKAALTVI
jgi:hypothetical protein